MTFTEIVVALLAAVVAEEVLGITEMLSVWLVKRHARRLPAQMRESYEEEWLRHLTELHGGAAKLIFSLDLWRASYFIGRESHRSGGVRADAKKAEAPDEAVEQVDSTPGECDEVVESSATFLGVATHLGDRLRTLTPREEQVFRLVVSGLLNRQIAAKLGTAVKTIKVHRARVMRKMEVGSLIELVHAAQILGVRSHDIVFGDSDRRLPHRIDFDRVAIAVAGLKSLTPRECQVLELLLVGRFSREIAQYLGISNKTAKRYRACVMRKLGVESLPEMLYMVQLADTQKLKTRQPPRASREP